MLERNILQIKMDPLQQHVGRHEHLWAFDFRLSAFDYIKIHDRAVIADTFLRTRLHMLNTFGQMLDQTKLTIF